MRLATLRNMVGVFSQPHALKHPAHALLPSLRSGSPEATGGPVDEALGNGYMVVARTLARLGIRYMYGVIGIPVTELASAAQACLCLFLWQALPAACLACLLDTSNSFATLWR